MAGLLRHALTRVIQEGSAAGSNLIAFSGGVDSSLVAALVHDAFPGRAYACLGGGFASSTVRGANYVCGQAVAMHVSHGFYEDKRLCLLYDFCCAGVSPSLPAVQLDQARTVAQHIGERWPSIGTAPTGRR